MESSYLINTIIIDMMIRTFRSSTVSSRSLHFVANSSFWAVDCCSWSRSSFIPRSLSSDDRFRIADDDNGWSSPNDDEEVVEVTGGEEEEEGWELFVLGLADAIESIFPLRIRDESISLLLLLLICSLSAASLEGRKVSRPVSICWCGTSSFEGVWWTRLWDSFSCPC